MIIILEGPEAAGKSTLSQRLSQQTGFPVVHRSKPKDEAEKLSMMRMYEEAIYNSHNVIFDRCWYSEMVYGEIMRDKSYISIDQMYELEDALARNGGGLVMHCTAPIETLWHRCNARGEDYVKDIETLDKIREGFEGLLHNVAHKIPVVKYEFKESMPWMPVRTSDRLPQD